MTFLYPMGLLGLIGIPVFIIIYIIKNKYTEQTVSSTYLWTLSERFLKKRNPFNKLTGIISLILQLLAVTVLSFAVAHPVIVLPNAANEYCFILDASGSMNMTADGKTRFDLAKEQISSVIDGAVNGSTYTLIRVGENTTVVFEKTENKEQALLLLGETEPAHNMIDYTDAIGTAQGYFNENPAVQTYLVTDQAYDENKNIHLINVSRNEENYAVSNVSHLFLGETLTVTGTAMSYESDAELTLQLYVNGEETPSVTKPIAVTAGEGQEFFLECKTEEFFSLRVCIAEEDSLSLDNSCVIYDVKSENAYNTLLVSERPFLIRSVLSSVGASKMNVITPEDYRGQSGYGLYIFDSYTPESLPKDGAVWLINPVKSVEGAGFSIQGEVALNQADEILLSDSSSSTVRRLTANMSGEGIYVSGYTKCGVYGNFYTLLSYKGNPLVFTGTNENGNREVVFAFDLHASNFTMTLDYIALAKNLIDFSFPTVLEETLYQCGDTLEINVVANCDSLRVDSPTGKISYLETDSAVSEFLLQEAGTYTVTMTVADTPREFHIFSELSPEERDPTATAEELSLMGEPGTDGFDGIYDNLMILFICLAVLFAADWVVYCYEKYQLR